MTGNEKRNKSLFIPLYTEVALFLMSTTFLVLLATNPDLQQGVYYLLHSFSDNVIGITIIMLFFLIPLILTIYHAFSNKEKTAVDKKLMLVFVFIINVSMGLSSGVYLLAKTTQWYLLIFPWWNIISSIFLMFLLKELLLQKEHHRISISDKQAKMSELIIGIIAVVIIFLVAQYVFELFWAITFSICIAYAMTLNEFLSKALLPKIL